MNNIELKNAIEAIMFAIGRPVSPQEISTSLDVQLENTEKAMIDIQEKYLKSECGISCVKVMDKYQLVTNKKYYYYVESVIGGSKKENLSNACMEVLSIIAYNPKITKSEIENIRGANSDSQVSKLIEYGLIEEVGRLKVIGRPAIFEVTNEFLKSMGLNKIQDLPDFEKMKSKDIIQDKEVEE